MYQLMIRIQIVQHHISIEFVRCCEHHYLVLFICFSQALYRIWSHINTCINKFAIRKDNFKHLIRHFTLQIIHTMNQSFIQIKYDSFFLCMWVYRWWQHQCFLRYFLFRRSFHLLQILQRL